MFDEIRYMQIEDGAERVDRAIGQALRRLPIVTSVSISVGLQHLYKRGAMNRCCPDDTTHIVSNDHQHSLRHLLILIARILNAPNKLLGRILSRDDEESIVQLFGDFDCYQCTPLVRDVLRFILNTTTDMATLLTELCTHVQPSILVGFADQGFADRGRKTEPTMNRIHANFCDFCSNQQHSYERLLKRAQRVAHHQELAAAGKLAEIYATITIALNLP